MAKRDVTLYDSSGKALGTVDANDYLNSVNDLILERYGREGSTEGYTFLDGIWTRHKTGNQSEEVEVEAKDVPKEVREAYAKDEEAKKKAAAELASKK
jgi:hypothetical protein